MPKQQNDSKKNPGGSYHCSICGMIIPKSMLAYWRDEDVYCGPVCSMKGYNQKYKENSKWE
jgi:hypothetical protein